MAAGIAELRGHRLRQDAGGDRLRQARILGFREAARIDSEQQVGGAVLPFGGQPLVEARRCVDHVGLDARLVRERLEQRIDQLRFAIGIDVDLTLRHGGGRKSGTSNES